MRSTKASRVVELWAHIYGPGPGILCLFSGIRPEPSSRRLEDTRSAYFTGPEEQGRARAWAERESAASREVYHCGHLLTARRRIKANAAPLLALYVDGDGAKVPEHLPSPTATVETSSGREQFYWRLIESVSPEVGERLNRRLALALGGDRSGWDLTQLLRPPGTRNYKYPEAPIVRILELKDECYNPTELDRLLPPLPRPRQTRARSGQGDHKVAARALSDEELLDRAMRAANGEKFRRLFSGDTGEYATAANDGHSEADLALCSLLAFWCGPDEGRIDALFRQSGLYRAKWDERHYADGRTYGQGTIAKALERGEFWSNDGAHGPGRGKVYARREEVVTLG